MWINVKNFSQFLPLTLMLGFIFNAPACAQQNRMESAYHVELGDKLSFEKKFDTAALEYVKALLADVENRSAREKLGAVFSQTDLQTSKAVLQQQYFLELIDYVQFLFSRINSLLEDNDSLARMLSSYPGHEKISVKAVTLSENLKQENAQIASAHTAWGQRQAGWIAFNDLFVEQKNRLSKILNEVGELNRDLHARRWQIHSAQKNKHIGAQAGHWLDRIKDLEMTRIHKEEIITQQSKNIALLTDEINVMRQQFVNLQAKFNSTQQRIDDLGKDLAAATLEIYQRDQQLANKEQQVTKIKDELVELRERSVLMQRIIQEKELKNLTAENPLDYAARIQTLEQQFQELNQRYLVMEKNLADREREVARLRQELALRDDKIMMLKNAFNSKEQRIGELLGVVEIYKSKLGESKKVLDGLDHRLDQFQNRVDASSPESALEQRGKPVRFKSGVREYTLDDVIKQLSGDLPAMKVEKP